MIIKKHLYRLLFISFIVFINILLSKTADAKTTLETQRTDFLEAYDILHKGGLYFGDHLRSYALYPYLDYERIKQHLDKTNRLVILDYINRYDQSWMADDLRTELMKRFAIEKKWHAVSQYYKKGAGGYAAKCLNLEAKTYTQSGAALNQTLKQAMKLWLSGNPRPQVCSSLFQRLLEKGRINNQTAWERITLAMNKGNTSLAKSLAKFTNNKTLVSVWTKVRKHPAKNLKDKKLKKDTPRIRQIIAYGIKRMARKDASKAKQQWLALQKTHRFNNQEKADIESYIGVRLALDRNPYALQKLYAIPARLRSQDANIWLARLAIRKNDWSKVLNAISALPHDLREKDIWQYWQAYAEKKTGRKVTVNLNKLAQNASFYGFLAADQQNLPYRRLLQKEPNWDQLIPSIAQRPAIKRATELFAINMPKLAKKEWYWQLKQLNNREKLIAAAYAHKINQPFLGIITVSQTKDWNQVGLRFPMRYKKLVQKVARSQGILPAWVYAIMRRESAFDPAISSSANAQGLMQVLPATARSVAKKLGIRNHTSSDLLIPEKNALLGAGYLRQMLTRFKGNYVKATASYNAGPHRIPKWAPDYPLPAPNWIESIPFNETRNYVRAVMSYTTIYDHKLNYKKRRNLRLSYRLQTITPE